MLTPQPPADLHDHQRSDDEAYRPAPQTTLGFVLYVLCILGVLAAAITLMDGDLAMFPLLRR